MRSLLPACLGLLAITACEVDSAEQSVASGAASAATTVLVEPPGEAAPARSWHRAPTHQGSALVRGARDEALYIADEDHARLVIAPLPLGSRPLQTFALPGRPAQVLALEDRLLVTVRDPGLLLSIPLEPGDVAPVRIAQRVALPADAWGLAVDDDEDTAFVTSAWTHRVTGIDLADGAVLFDVEVAREPRGIAVLPGGRTAYVTHLVGSDLTRIDGLDGPTPQITRVPLPAGRLSTPRGSAPLDASLAYAPVLSPDGERLFVPRHALGGLGWAPWFGRPTVDVLSTSDDAPFAPARTDSGMRAHERLRDFNTVADDGESLALPLLYTVQPRAAVFRRSTGTLIVASEGHGRITELDARAADPSVHPLYRYELIHDGREAERCGAPSGVALSPDERHAYVWCRTTSEIASMPLKSSFAAGPDGYPDRPSFLAVPFDPLPEPAETGRRLFFDARSDDERNAGVSGGLGCAGCHPDGRDDGHVWLETPEGSLFGGELRRGSLLNLTRPLVGAPRQTPMLAGRVSAAGPYGWRGEQKTLEDRVIKGFTLHRWFGQVSLAGNPAYRRNHQRHADALAAFLRQGLVAPPRAQRALSVAELRGKQLFDEDAGCANCHDPATDFTNRARLALHMGRSPFKPTTPETNLYRVPSLLNVGGTAPYMHDGRYSTLDDLMAELGDEMGTTAQLPPDDLRALTAYVRTIGEIDDDPGSSPAGLATRAAPAPERFPFPVRTSTIEPSTLAVSDLSDLVRSPPSEAVSPAPDRQEWDDAPELEVLHMPDDCRAWRVREWVRIQCIPAHGSVFRVALIAGDQQGVELRHEHRQGFDHEAVVVFPVRRGDQRFFEIDREVVVSVICWKYRSWFQAGTFMISESWAPGQAAPTLVITRYGRHKSTGALIPSQRCG